MSLVGAVQFLTVDSSRYIYILEQHPSPEYYGKKYSHFIRFWLLVYDKISGKNSFKLHRIFLVSYPMEKVLTKVLKYMKMSNKLHKSILKIGGARGAVKK